MLQGARSHYLGQNFWREDFVGSAGREVQKRHQLCLYKRFNYGEGLINEPRGVNDVDFLKPHRMSFLELIQTLKLRFSKTDKSHEFT